MLSIHSQKGLTCRTCQTSRTCQNEEMKSEPPPPCPFEPLHPSELHRDEAYYMSYAYNESLKAWRANEIPIGAVV